jgi:Lipoprotein LpqB beta-propeller domain/Sporulation and spore germination
MRRALVVALAAALVLGGCGIPDNTPVLPIGLGPSTGTSSGDDVTPALPRREDTEKPSQLVLNYLKAAAGDPDGALARVKAFLSPAAAAMFKPKQPNVRVIHLVEEPLNNPGSGKVSFKAWQVGTLGNNGILDPSTDPKVDEYEFLINALPGHTGLFVTKAQPMLLLSDDALGGYYDLRTIYFWNTDHTALVPDVRYMPKSVPPEQQPTEVLTWLIAGPSPWLDQAVESLPEGTNSIGNVPAVSNDKLQINLSDKAVPPSDKGAALDRLRRQLMWSLRPNLPSPGYLELKIGHQVKGDWDQSDYLTSNASYRLRDDPERFVVYDGRVRRLSQSAYATEPVPALLPDANRNVLAAALSSSDTRTYAAVVVDDRGKQSLRVAGVRTGERAALKKVAIPGRLGHPVWAVTPDETQGGAIGLITTADGRLYSFGSGGGVAREIEIDWPGGEAPAISVVAVAPDAHRIALVAGGKLYLTVLVTGGDGPQLAPPQQIRTPMRTLTAVDWSGEGWLVVGGTRADTNRVAIMDMTIDGAIVSARLPDLGTDQVSYLTAYPANPKDGRQSSDSIAYVAGGGAYDALADATKITVADLADPVTNPPARVVPTAPLFLR